MPTGRHQHDYRRSDYFRRTLYRSTLDSARDDRRTTAGRATRARSSRRMCCVFTMNTGRRFSIIAAPLPRRRIAPQRAFDEDSSDRPY